MEIYLNIGHTFSVPVTVADHLLKLASHDQLKVLLYVLCHAGEQISADAVVRACNVRPEAIEEALVFWQNVNVLMSDQPAFSCAVQQSAAPAAIPAEAPKLAANPPAAQAVRADVQANSSSFSLKPSEIAERKQRDPAVAELFAGAEQCARRMLNQTELKSLIWMHEYLGLTPDVILMLVAFCAEIDAFQVRYMEQIAVEWQERGITAHAAVQQDIQRRLENRSFTGQIMKLFEMRRKPTAKQQAYISKWQQAGFSPELIAYAYEETRDHTDDVLSFPYLDSILTRLADAGIQTVAQAKQDQAAFQAAKRKKKRSSGSDAAAPETDTAHSSFSLEDVKSLVNQF